MNDFDDMKQTISRLIRSQQLAGEKTEKESKKMEAECYIGLLPPELIATILSFLAFEDQKECRLVCHRWRLALEVTDFYHHCCIVLDDDVPIHKKVEKLKTFSFSSSPFHFFSLSSFPSFSNFPLCSEAISSSVQSLHLTDCEVSEKELLLILSNLPNIKSLGLINCRELFMTGTFLVNDVDKESLAKSLTKLDELILDNNTYLSDVLLLRIAGVTNSIEKLRYIYHFMCPISLSCYFLQSCRVQYYESCRNLYQVLPRESGYSGKLQCPHMEDCGKGDWNVQEHAVRLVHC